MKQILVVLTIGILLMGGYVALTRTATESIVKEEDISILLYIEQGDVSYKTENMQNFQRATSTPTIISNNTQVHTGIGKATVLFPNNSSVQLDHYTELTVTYKDNNISLFQTLGSTYHRVEALITGATYEVETPGTLAAVRGTKFAVKYDKKKKETKVAVTERQVDVARLKERLSATGAREIIEQITLLEGKTARLDAQATSTAFIPVVDTSTDADMKTWVETNQRRDKVLDSLEDGTRSPEEVRTELRSLLSGQKSEEDFRHPDGDTPETKENTRTKTEDIPRTETKPATQTKPTTTTTEPKPTTDDSATAQQSVILKLGEEEFFDKFNTLFVNHFYLDEKDTPCSIRVTPTERVRLVSSFAAESGYAFTSRTLLDFAQAIDAYCANKDVSLKAKLQARFDAEFPFQEEI